MSEIGLYIDQWGAVRDETGRRTLSGEWHFVVGSKPEGDPELPDDGLPDEIEDDD